MKFHCLAFVLILVSIASGQLTECNPANNTTVNSTAALIQTPELAINTSRDIGVTLDAFVASNDTTHIFDLNAPESAKYLIYRIEVRNSGDVQIDGILLSAVLAKGMFFMNSSYSDSSRGKLIAKVEPPAFDKNLETNVRWNLGSLAPEETKTVIMTLFLKSDVVASNVDVTVTGTTIDGIGLTDSQGTANVFTECAYFIADDEGNFIIPVSRTEVLAGLYPDVKTNCPSLVSQIIDLDFEVIEIGSESARFGIGKKEPAKHEMYKISIMNKGDIRITDVIVSAEMEKDMKFESTRYYEDIRGRLDVIVDPPYFNKGAKTNLTWDVTTLEPEETKTILLEAYIKPGVNKTNISVDVTGEYAGSSIGARRGNAIVAKCDYVNRNTGDICSDSSDTENCVNRCPPWSIPQ